MGTLARRSPGGAAELVDHSGAASREGSGLEPSSFGDAPVRSREEDLLSWARFATTVAQAFVAYPEADSLVVALYGPWGSGKTSTLNFALEALVESEGVSIGNEPVLPRGGASFVVSEGRLLGSDNRAKGSALA